MVGVVTNGTMAGVLLNGMVTGVLLDGTKVGNKRMTLPQAHFPLGGLDVSATSSPKRFEWVKMNLGAGCSEHISIELWSRRSRRWKVLSDCQW